MTVAEGAVYAAPNDRAHPGWVVRVLRVRSTAVRFVVLAGPGKSKGRPFSMPRAHFEREFQPQGETR